MSFRDSQTTLRTTNANTTKYVIPQQTPEYGGLPKKSTTYFAIGWGKTAKNKKGQQLTLEEVFGLDSEGKQVAPEQVLRFDKANFKVDDGSEKGKWVNWHFTGDNDPLTVLGYGHNHRGNLLTVPAEVNKIPQRNNAKLNKIYNGKLNYTKFLQTQIHCPVILFSGDDFRVENGEPAILILNFAQFKDVMKLAEKYALSSKANKSLFGHVLQLNKNSALGTKAYQWVLPDVDVELPDNFETTMQELLNAEAQVLEKIYENVNGGSPDSTNVWNYLLNVAGLPYEQFVAKYSIKLDATIDPNPSSVISFDDEEEVDEDAAIVDQPF